jgi:hypothetical protein
VVFCILMLAGVGSGAFYPAHAAAGQEAAVSEKSASIPVSTLESLVNREGTTVQYGNLYIGKGETARGPLVVVNGNAFVSGTVDGDLTLLNGSASLQREAVVTGDLTVAGGYIYASRQARVAGRRTYTDDRYLVTGAAGRLRIRYDRPAPVGAALGLSEWRFSRVRGHEAALRLGIEPRTPTGYPRIAGTVLVPTIRTNHGYLDFHVSVEEPLFERRTLRLGVAGYKKTDTADDWHMPASRNALMAFVTRNDFYNYHTRRGVAVYATQHLTAGVSLGLAYAHDTYFNLPGHAPFTLFRRDRPFRPNPVIDEGNLRSLIWRFQADTRRPEERPANAWYVEAEMERALSALGSDFAYTRYDVTLRRYNAWRGHHLDIRAKIAGSGAPLPLQRVYVLGAMSGLRGFGDFECAGDRLLIANVEYRLPVATFRREALVPWRLEWLAFFDAGTAFFSRASGRNSLLHPATRDRIDPRVGLPLPARYTDLRYAAGAGLTLSSRLIDATLAVAQNLHTTAVRPRVLLFLYRDLF